MIAAAVITIVGIGISIGVTQLTGLRMGGVIVIPLLAVYSLYSFWALPLFLISAVIAYCLVGLIRNHTLIHGRQLLLTSLGVGAVAPIGSALLFETWNIFDSTIEIAFFGTILPGIAAYNYHKLDIEQRRKDVLVSGGTLVGLLVFGASFVNPTFATQFNPSLTSILFTSASDIAQYRQAVRGSVAPTTMLDRAWTLLLLLAGLGISELAHARWGVRMGGLIAIPLLVVLSLTNVWALGVYLVGLAVVYAAITAINALTLVYGRVLLSLGIITAMGYGMLVASYFPVVTGFSLYFTVILTGVGAYNFHRIAPAERTQSVALSAGLFSLLLAGSRGFIDPTPAGALTTVSTGDLLLLLGTICLGIYCAYLLEERRRTIAAHHSRGILT